MSEENIQELKYEPSGSIFTNERKRGALDPDYNGYMKITSEVLDYLIEKRKKQIALWEKKNPNIDWKTVDKTKMFDLQCDMIAWGKKTKKGTNWLRLIATIPYKEKKNKGNPF